MRPERTLRLTRERLAELTSDELRAAGGAAAEDGYTTPVYRLCVVLMSLRYATCLCVETS